MVRSKGSDRLLPRDRLLSGVRNAFRTRRWYDRDGSEGDAPGSLDNDDDDLRRCYASADKSVFRSDVLNIRLQLLLAAHGLCSDRAIRHGISNYFPIRLSNEDYTSLASNTPSKRISGESLHVARSDVGRMAEQRAIAKPAKRR